MNPGLIPVLFGKRRGRDFGAAIRALFSAGQPGFWHDITDRSTLFQDSAGTTPVTAYGQFVGLIKDKSGNGMNATASTTAKRSLYTQDAAGRPCLLPDGVDDDYDVVLQNRFGGATKVGFVAAFRKEMDLTRRSFFDIGTTSNAGGIALFSPPNNGNNFSLRLQNQSINGFIDLNTGALPAPITVVLSGNMDLNRVDQSQILNFWANGSANGGGNSNGGMSQIDPLNNNFKYFSGQGSRHNGYFYGCVMRAGSILSDDERQSVESYLRTATGAY